MRRIAAAASVVLLAVAARPHRAEAQSATASSEWGPGYGAAVAADGIADENGNYWQTVQNQDRGAWWQIDLGREATVGVVKIAWARWEDKVHCPPARLVIQVSRSGAAGPWKDVLTVGPKDLPGDGQPCQADRPWQYVLPRPTPARYVRLLFPEGGQAGAKYPGYLCLGEVEVPVPELPAQIVTIEGKFGKAEINVKAPAMTALVLRGPGGLASQSLLARRPVAPYGGYSRGRGRLPWGCQAYTYAVAQDGTRYESRGGKPEGVAAERGGLRISGVALLSDKGPDAAAVEDWTFSMPGDGSQLAWNIVRRWKKDVTVTMSGSPGLFFGFDGRRVSNSVTSTLWYDPERLAVRPSELYNVAVSLPGRICENHVQTVLDRDAWAIYKLWTNWHAPADLRLEVRGGHLYRRGSFAFLSEAGAVADPRPAYACRRGQVDEITLSLGAVDKYATGYQLAISLPDKATEASLKDFYGSVFNGGAVNDQKNFDFGNETDGWYYAGSSWMYGAALAAGAPAPGRLASRPFDAQRAFRGHLARIMNTLDAQGRSHFGYNQGGEWVDDNLHTILGAQFYLVHSGDLAFVRRQLPAMERMLEYFIRRRDARGLFALEGTGAHWYYDAINTGGVNGYYNAFFCRAAQDLSAMEEAAGDAAKARRYRDLAESLSAAYNRVLWRENLPGGPRYLDWIDAQGHEIGYFCDLCQWPAIAVGIASPAQARKIVATADARIKELKKEYGYGGYASLSALWPVPKALNPVPWQTFGTYMNGGSLLCQTYWEVLARARAGDHQGAARRLRLFAQRAGQTSWVGNNSADIHGQRGSIESGEPYLADMVAATAAMVHGVLGIRPTWKGLEVTPHLPPDWNRAEAEVLCMGQRYRVVIAGGRARVQAIPDR
jgi:hypothetical protein